MPLDAPLYRCGLRRRRQVRLDEKCSGRGKQYLGPDRHRVFIDCELRVVERIGEPFLLVSRSKPDHGGGGDLRLEREVFGVHRGQLQFFDVGVAKEPPGRAPEDFRHHRVVVKNRFAGGYLDGSFAGVRPADVAHDLV